MYGELRQSQLESRGKFLPGNFHCFTAQEWAVCGPVEDGGRLITP